MRFAVLLVWHKPQDQSSDCYFGIKKIKGNSGKYKHKFHNPNLPSTMRPVSHSKELLVPHPSVHLVVEDESKAAMEVECEE
ncbi:hypothetical protein AVEN_4045-1 [Araneus ventricosus]|uniref:Uncharacterized protein n=1 Tax=Araneus ventricosus TaxID=182803 RepID=A0A4Y2MAE6_ARAVE|nr:hypothetical protein AVEN_4045-1 [Araneus ventricosus]